MHAVVASDQPEPQSSVQAPDAVNPEIRVATAKDNGALLELSRACPMEADISLSIEREPSFFNLSRARGEGQTYVAEIQGQIVACGSVCTRSAYLLGEPGVMGYVSDIKVAPRFRHLGVAQRLLDEIATNEDGKQAAPYVASAAAGNSATDAMILRFGQGRAIQRLTSVTSYQLLPLFRFRVKSDLEIAPAEARDENDLVEFLDSYHRSFSFAPTFFNGAFNSMLKRSPGMNLNSYWIARRRGHLVAAVGLWDEAEMKRTRVCRMTTGLRVVSRVLQGGRKILPLPPFPTEGELLSFFYLRHPAYAEGELESLGGLVRFILNEVATKQHHFMLFSCADTDPISGCIRGIPHTKYHYGLVAGTNSPEYEKQLTRYSNDPLFDDAALS